VAAVGWLSRHLASAAVVAGAACWLAPAAWAAPAWTGASAFPVPAGAGSVQVGYAGGGVATLAWISGGVLHAGVRAPGDAYVEQLSATLPAGSDSASLRLAVSGDGAAAIVFAVSGGLDVMTRSAGGGWSPARVLSAPPASAPALGFDGADRLTAVWIGSSGLTASVESGGTWSAPQVLDPAAVAGHVSLAVSGDGSAAALYPTPSGASVVSRSGSAGAWSGPSLLAPGSAPLGVAMTEGDTAYALVSGTCVAAARFAAGAGAATVSPACLSGAGGADAPSGGVAALGEGAVLAWSGAGGVQGAVWAASDPAPGAPVTLDPAPGGAGVQQVVADQDGGVAVLWQAPDGSTRAAAYDGGGPNLLYTDVPSSTAARQPTAYAAAFADLWSGVQTPAWSFGDGSPVVAGAQVAHAYASPGSYTVTVVAADGLGNTTTRSFTVSVGTLPRRAHASRRPHVSRRWHRQPRKRSRRAAVRR
jgi:hypothetical protein